MILFLGTLSNIGTAFELITAIIGTCYYYKYKHVPVLKYFVFLLWYIVCNEFISYCLNNLEYNNKILYNLYHTINFTYLLLLYRQFLNGKHKVIVSTLVGLYVTAVMINGFYENYVTEYQSIPYIIGASFLIISIILYFIMILNSKQVLYTDKILLFWISFGLLLYYVGTIPFRILLNYYESKSDATVHFLLNFSLTIIMNLFFIIGFVWSSDKQHG